MATNLQATRLAFFAGALASTALACTEFEPATDVLTAAPETSVAQQQTAGVPGRDWSCLGVAANDPMLVRNIQNAPRLVQSLQILSLATGQVPSGVTVRACAQRDVSCTEPLTANIPLDAQGWVDLPLYEGFDGYLEITGESVVSTALFYADPLAAGSLVDQTPLGLVEKALLPGLSAATGTPQESTLGLVYLRAFDCGGVPAPGVSFAIDHPGVRWYFVDGLPTSLPDETAESGLGGFINVQPGISVVNAALAGGGPIAPPKSVLVRANWMTGLRFIPGR